MIHSNGSISIASKLLLALLASVAVSMVDASTPVASVSFAGGTHGFQYADDTFRNTTAGDYAYGRRLQGRISIWLGGKDNLKIDGMSGGYKRSFTLDHDSKNVKIILQYELETRNAVGPSNIVQAMASFGGKLISAPGKNGAIDSLHGLSTHTNYRMSTTTFTANLGPYKAGTHELILGGFMNTKDSIHKRCLVWFRSVSISADYLTDVSIEDVNFDKSTEGFKFVGDPLRNDPTPKYATGAHEENRLSVTLGGVDNQLVGRMEGYWAYNITFPRDMVDVRVSLMYEVELRAQVHTDSIVQVKAQLGDKIMTSNGGDVVVQVRGRPEDENVRTSTRTYTIDLGSFAAGTHTLLLGGSLNRKDSEAEECLVWFKSVNVTARY